MSTDVHLTDRGSNFRILELPTMRIAFSYETPIAFVGAKSNVWEWVVRENEWGPTTGRHLNEINSDHSVRIPGDEFEARLLETLTRKLPTGAIA